MVSGFFIFRPETISKCGLVSDRERIFAGDSQTKDKTSEKK